MSLVMFSDRDNRIYVDTLDDTVGEHFTDVDERGGG